MNFAVQTIDDSSRVQRVVVLYRRLSDHAWSRAKWPYTGDTHMASASVSGLTGTFDTLRRPWTAPARWPWR